MIFPGLELSIWLLTLIAVITIWDGVWKLIAMWKAAKKNSVVWFVVLALLNTAGILPILYIYVFSKGKKEKRKIKRK